MCARAPAPKLPVHHVRKAAPQRPPSPNLFRPTTTCEGPDEAQSAQRNVGHAKRREVPTRMRPRARKPKFSGNDEGRSRHEGVGGAGDRGAAHRSHVAFPNPSTDASLATIRTKSANDELEPLPRPLNALSPHRTRGGFQVLFPASSSSSIAPPSVTLEDRNDARFPLSLFPPSHLSPASPAPRVPPAPSHVHSHHVASAALARERGRKRLFGRAPHPLPRRPRNVRWRERITGLPGK